MLLRPGLSSRAARTLRHPTLVAPISRRGLAAPSSGTFSYQTDEVAGVKCASRDLAGPTTTLALVAKAGTRYQPLPGLAEGLEKFAFRVCWRRFMHRLASLYPWADLCLFRTHNVDLHYVSFENQSSSARHSSHHIPARASSLAPNFSVMTSHTTWSCWERWLP